MSNMFADLHLHTSFSDGTYSPEEVVAQARAHGLAALAITDHDTVEGCPRVAAACEPAGIEFLSGTELTAEQEGEEIHILGYFIDTSDPGLLAEVGRFPVRPSGPHSGDGGATERTTSSPRLRSRLHPGKLPSARPPHVARALVQAGLCASLDEAFERFLKTESPRLGAQIQNVGDRGDCLVAPRRRSCGHGTSGPGPHRPHYPAHGRGGSGRPGVFSHQALHSNDGTLPRARPTGLSSWSRAGRIVMA